MELQDFTGLRSTEKVVVPLNGVRYHCVPEVAAAVITEMAPGAASDVPELPDGVTMEDVAKMSPAELADLPPSVSASAGRAGVSHMVRMMTFFRDVMEPDSHTQWLENMRPPAPDLTPAKRTRHLDRMVTLRQMTAVFQALVAHYAGRPTTPSSSWSNGDGGTGGSSTAVAPSGA